MGLLNTLRFIVQHPLNRGRRLASVGRFASWQIRTRLVPGPVVVDFVDDTRLLISRGQTGATGNVYTGLHELPEMAFVLHALRPGELFVDVGANVGTYTVLAAGAAGATCIAFEPAETAFAALRANVSLNDLGSRVELKQCAVGATDGAVLFTYDQDTRNHVVSAEEAALSMEVPLTALDNALGDLCPVVIKIDVEGFESEVLRGAASLLQRPELLAVVIETNSSGLRYSADADDNVHSILILSGFVPCVYDPFKRLITPIGRRGTGENTIYVRDIQKACERVAAAPRFNIAGRRTL